MRPSQEEGDKRNQGQDDDRQARLDPQESPVEKGEAGPGAQETIEYGPDQGSPLRLRDAPSERDEPEDERSRSVPAPGTPEGRKFDIAQPYRDGVGPPDCNQESKGKQSGTAR
jgi:hypothetical protein